MPDVDNITTDITVADIQLILQIIDACAKRGAFRSVEFSVIGDLVTKLTAAISPSTEEAKKSDNIEEQLELQLP